MPCDKPVRPGFVHDNCPRCREYPVGNENDYPPESLFTKAEHDRVFPTGARRQSLEEEVRFDLISPEALYRLAQTYAEGAAKYGDNNWRKGLPFSNLLNHTLNHINAWLLLGGSGEDHLAHAAWGLFALMEQEITHPELDDTWDFLNGLDLSE